MKNKFYVLFLTGWALCFGARAAALDSVSVPKKASFIETYGVLGTVFKTNDFVKNMAGYRALSLRCAFAANGGSWEDVAYNMPFWGIGFYKPVFRQNPGLGKPFSLYLFRGSTLAQFSENLGLILELNLGLSMNWKSYDPVENPDNVAIGSSSNAHVGLRMYLEYFLTQKFNLKFGVDLNHFSNGNARMPNKGVNMGGLSFSLAYHLNPPDKGELLRHSPLKIPKIQKHLEHEVQAIFTNRQILLSSGYPEHNFTVLGLIYSPAFVNDYKYKWGFNVHFTYDESIGARAWDEQNSVNIKPYSPEFSQCLSLGLALRGEIVMPIASVYASVGYERNLYNQRFADKPLFQTIGIKAYFRDNFFGCFGINATDFSIAKYLTWSLGYTLNK